MAERIETGIWRKKPDPTSGGEKLDPTCFGNNRNRHLPEKLGPDIWRKKRTHERNLVARQTIFPPERRGRSPGEKLTVSISSTLGWLTSSAAPHPLGFDLAL